MTTLYKLTDQDGMTYNQTCWLPLGTEHTASGTGGLCACGWLHAYEHPLIAVFINPIHANVRNPRMFVCEGDIGKRDSFLKVGCTRLKSTCEMDVPAITTEQRVEGAIRIALLICRNEKFATWADDWLSGKDRTESTAESAAWSAAESEAWSTAESAAWSAARSEARSAARRAAWSEAWSEAWSAARSAARSAAWSTAWSTARRAARSAAESAARSAAESAAWSTASEITLDTFVSIVDKVLQND